MYNPVADLPKSQMYRDMAALGLYDMDSNTLVLNEMRAYQYGFQSLLALIDEIALDWWPPDCSQKRLEEWEGILKIPHRAGTSLEQRREGILRYLTLGTENHTPAGMQKALLAAGIRGEIEEDCQNQRITLRVTGLEEGFESLASCVERVRRLLPAHMAVEVVSV